MVPSGAIISSIIPVFANDWSSSLINSIINNVLSYKTFGVRYDVPTKLWTLIQSQDLGSADFSLSNAGDTSGTSLDSSWFIKFSYANQEYSVTSRGLNY